ncbi:protein POOR HOMOLOGOUS SYNAPSIS 1 isoform X1 [Telopea speciosissima]|uniref:protein POOR HOMOLOGOUS SYNAPSIS 1 isoform X1 n=1 Tax=Telopea speciosissima TaxID=54955 RepID=UPI001CC3FEFA|nr:protein POOR HOMOLOGOUS SYNAPSIS 1 isoform X1 [Telopea speciosissima]
MAGALSLIETGNVETSFTAIVEHWEVEFSRFFNFPSPPSPSLVLKPLRKSIIHGVRGSWLSSSSTASLDLRSYHSSSEVILVVSLRGKIYEEHFLSNLHFSWPQVSCVYQCPTKGSRVVFASYKDSVGQIQKFALRFITSSEAETFINVLKERLKDIIDIGYPQNNIKSNISSEVSSSNGFQCRAEEDAIHVTPDVSYVTPALTYTPQMLPLDYKAAQTPCLQEPVPAYNLESVLPALPPSFTALLASCCTEAEQEKPKVVPEEVDIMNQITKCMLDSSFNDVLVKVEKYITEMGGNLSI